MRGGHQGGIRRCSAKNSNSAGDANSASRVRSKEFTLDTNLDVLLVLTANITGFLKHPASLGKYHKRTQIQLGRSDVFQVRTPRICVPRCHSRPPARSMATQSPTPKPGPSHSARQAYMNARAKQHAEKNRAVMMYSLAVVSRVLAIRPCTIQLNLLVCMSDRVCWGRNIRSSTPLSDVLRSDWFRGYTKSRHRTLRSVAVSARGRVEED